MAEKNQEKKLSEEEKEKQREAALPNLKSSISDLAVAYFVNTSGEYGKAGDSAVEQFIYQPALKTEKGAEITLAALLNSRTDNEPYSGNVSERVIIKTAAAIFQESLARVKVNDIYSLMGSAGVNIRKDYSDRYLADFQNSDASEEYKKFAGNLVGGYLGYLINTKVSKALSKRASAIKGSLEEIVKEPEKKAA